MHSTGLKYLTLDTLFNQKATANDQAPIEQNILHLLLRIKATAFQNIASTANLSMPLEIADTRMVSRVVENQDAKRRTAVPTLQNFVQHQATKAFCKQATHRLEQANESIPSIRAERSFK